MAPKADPGVVRELVNRYDTLRSHGVRHTSSSIHPRMEGIVYTLCVLTGTHEESKALAAARGLLARSDPARPPG
ncbi:hypothetical protein GCM10010387_28340 [Streptomyces inusitatus]|uniref:DUF5133 domain-containing protein n=1 Tax=Streptomyces inusitatus TaxID=68221 RepID=A0A918Q5C7_9ACTN|nr:DUF5133 domain-containing protein [Streptomyces inusitatus]GGZ32607.1 hypothetical protein GCM10010387_28340 [Streptomyces inusitatus]